VTTWNKVLAELQNKIPVPAPRVFARIERAGDEIKDTQARKIVILEKNNELLTESNNKLVKSNEDLLERIGWLEGQLNLFLTQTEGSA
jgi:hypothetical protein